MKSFKEGDEVIVIFCPRGDRELGWVGTVTEIFEMVLVDMCVASKGIHVSPITYFKKDIRKLTKLDKVLK